MTLRACSLIFTLISATPAASFVEVQFADGVPWDVFTITGTGCPISDAMMLINLRTSAAGVLIDTTYGGPGSQDPLPVESVSYTHLTLPTIA